MHCSGSILASFYSCLQEISLNTMAYISLVTASGPKFLTFDSLCFVTESIYTKNTYSVISHIVQCPFCKK